MITCSITMECKCNNVSNKPPSEFKCLDKINVYINCFKIL